MSIRLCNKTPPHCPLLSQDDCAFPWGHLSTLGRAAVQSVFGEHSMGAQCSHTDKVARTKGSINWEGKMGLRTEAIFLQRLQIQRHLEMGRQETDEEMAVTS